MVSPRSVVLDNFIASGGTFKTIKAGELFRVVSNPQLDKENFIFSPNSKYPYFTRTVFNNGLLGYVDYLDDTHLISGNSIAVGMMGMQFFYQSHDFYAGQFTKTIFPKFDTFNERIALWFIAWFNKNRPILLGGLVRDFERLFNDIDIEIPFFGNIIAFDYIESRIRELEESRIRELEAYLSESGFDNCDMTTEEYSALSSISNNSNIFKPKSIYNEVFNVVNSHNILKSEIVLGSGVIPYVTAGEGDNSVMGYISYNDEMLETGNSILIGGKTMVVTYQPIDFFSNDSHNLVLSLKNESYRSENVYLFLVASLKRALGHKYHWGDSISKQKIKSDVIMLPVNSNDEIDFDLMETLISAIKKKNILALKDYIASERQAYNVVTQSV